MGGQVYARDQRRGVVEGWARVRVWGEGWLGEERCCRWVSGSGGLGRRDKGGTDAGGRVKGTGDGVARGRVGLLLSYPPPSPVLT